jgi:hypothetical protein
MGLQTLLVIGGSCGIDLATERRAHEIDGCQKVVEG